MQIMPFWPRELGMTNEELVRIPQNIRMGCTILKFYLDREKGDYTKALARYNGSVGRRNYSDLVLTRLANRWQTIRVADSASTIGERFDQRDRWLERSDQLASFLHIDIAVTCSRRRAAPQPLDQRCAAAARRRPALRRARPADCAHSR